jgi:general secretion pathway protein D
MRRNRKALRRVATALLVAGMVSCQLAYAQVTLNFVNADIDQVAKAIGAATGKTIIVDPRVKGQLNLVSENPVPEEQALKTLQAALRMQGFALVQDHGVLKVVPEADAKLQGVPTYIGNQPVAQGDQVITQVFQLKNESASNVLPILRPLISPSNTVAAYPANNTIVVTDYADNVRRIARIIEGIDTAAGQQVRVVPLRNANALDVAPEMAKMLDPGAIGASDPTLKISVIADPRTNSLLLRASNAQRLASAVELAHQLDLQTAAPGNIHVVHLRNADATALAKTLRGMLGKGDSGGSASSSSANRFSQNNTSGSSGSTGTSGTPPLPTSMSGNASGSNPMGGGSASGTNTELPSDKEDTSDNQPGGMIQADPATNSLIITASDAVYRNLRTVIDELDQRRTQVYIEALIVQLSAQTSSSLGIQWQGALLSQGGNNGVYGGSNFNTSTSQGIVNLTGEGYLIGQNPSSALANSTSLLNNGLNIGILHKFGSYFGLGGLLQALSTSSDADVLSTPNLITLDNQEAKIVVGQNVPVETGSYATPTATTGSSVTAFNTYDREDVGTVLHVRPQITAGGLLKLELYTEVSSVDQSTINNPGGVTIDKQSVQSTVLANNGQIIVIGGLMQDNYSGGTNKVPLLGDIPWIGQLFRSENKTRTKTNLMVFLRPVIVSSEADSDAIAMQRYDYMREQQLGYTTDNRVIRDKDVPVIPAPAPPGTPPVDGLFNMNQMTRPPQEAPPPGSPTSPPALGVAPSAPAATQAQVPALLPAAEPPVAASSAQTLVPGARP